MGYTETAMTLFGSAGIAQLTVAISVPDVSVTIESSVSFFLLVNTSNNMTSGWCSHNHLKFVTTCVLVLSCSVHLVCATL